MPRSSSSTEPVVCLQYVAWCTGTSFCLSFNPLGLARLSTSHVFALLLLFTPAVERIHRYDVLFGRGTTVAGTRG